MADQILLDSLTETELDSLSVQDLTLRMDEILEANRAQRYGAELLEKLPQIGQHAPPVAAFLASKVIQERDEVDQRRLAYRYFSLVVQLELSMAASGLMNRVIYMTGDYDAEIFHRSPSQRITHAVLEQYTIISSRIMVDIFVDLLYDIGTGQPLPTSSRSRLGRFRKWLLDKGKATPHVYFAHVVLDAYSFDRSLRSPEIHGGSRIPRQLLLLQHTSGQIAHSLMNTILNVFRPLLTILDGERPSSFYFGDVVDEDWIRAYEEADTEVLQRKLETLFDEV